MLQVSYKYITFWQNNSRKCVIDLILKSSFFLFLFTNFLKKCIIITITRGERKRSFMADILKELEDRGYVEQLTHENELRNLLKKEG